MRVLLDAGADPGPTEKRMLDDGESETLVKGCEGMLEVRVPTICRLDVLSHLCMPCSRAGSVSTPRKVPMYM
eukprot:14933-Eustigmatos_ZCMA.PRE.1